MEFKKKYRVLIPAGNPEKYKEKAVLAVSTVVRYKESLYFSLVPTL